MSALLDSDSKVNPIYPTFIERLDFVMQSINVSAQKIDSITLEIYEIIVAAFSVINQADKVRFFKETFLIVIISPDVVHRMFLFTLNRADVDFPKRELWWRSYIIEKVLPTTKQVKLIGKKKFAATILDPRYETFVVYIASLESPSNNQERNIHLFRKVQIAALVANNTLTSISTEYSNFADDFSPKLVSNLSEYIGINNHAIELVDNWQLLYEPIYSLGSVELEILKNYIKINLVNSFITPSKFQAEAPIFFDKNLDGNFQLCVDYQELNNLIFKNRYSLLLVGQLLNQLGQAWQFAQLELMSIYHRIRIYKRDEWKTAFWTRYGHFKYLLIFFELTNTLATFQGYINKIFSSTLRMKNKAMSKSCIEFLTNWRNSLCMLIWKNVAFIRKKFDFLVI